MLIIIDPMIFNVIIYIYNMIPLLMFDSKYYEKVYIIFMHNKLNPFLNSNHISSMICLLLFFPKYK